MKTPSLRPLTLLTALAALLVASSVGAQSYPSKTIHMVVPYPAGGIADKVARDASAELAKRLNQTVVVDNRAGAAGNIGFDYVARQPADGYTLLLAPASNLTVQPALFKSLSYDLERDFVPVSLLVLTPQVLMVHPSVPVNNVKELVEYSKKNPSKVNFGVSIGAYSHLAGEMLKSQAGADFTPIPYQGTGPALNDLLAGQTQFIFNEVVTSIPHIQGNKLKPLAVAYRSRAPWLPNVPTMTEAGFPQFEVTSWYAVVAKTGTPQPIIDLVSRELNAIMQMPDFKKRYDDIGAFTVGGTPQELGAFIKSETVKWTAVVKQVGIQPN
ncbi:MAG: tripartite tricarboxylate transporter substrate binding protein [Comamonadaceae bacterium]|nr:MAG: tripartite tricarboxylate transporter substrate binding protein [Comamonadaceae bacterium]